MSSLHVTFSSCPIFAVLPHWVATMFWGWTAPVSEMDKACFGIWDFNNSRFSPVHDLHVFFGHTLVVAVKFHLPGRLQVLWGKILSKTTSLSLSPPVSRSACWTDMEVSGRGWDVRIPVLRTSPGLQESSRTYRDCAIVALDLQWQTRCRAC